MLQPPCPPQERKKLESDAQCWKRERLHGDFLEDSCKKKERKVCLGKKPRARLAVGW